MVHITVCLVAAWYRLTYKSQDKLFLITVCSHFIHCVSKAVYFSFVSQFCPTVGSCVLKYNCVCYLKTVELHIDSDEIPIDLQISNQDLQSILAICVLYFSHRYRYV